MRIERKVRVALFVLVVLSLPAACSSTVRFERVEHFPAGIQIDTLASAWLNRFQTSEVHVQFDAHYADVWQTAKVVARRLEKRVEKAEVTIDEEAGTIKLTDEQPLFLETAPDAGNRETLRRPGGSRLAGWKDEFLIHVIATSDGRTMVTVSRAVLGMPRYQFCIYVAALCRIGTLEPEISNGQIENWVLTQITDELERTMSRAGSFSTNACAQKV
jgi:hypothetical protein